MLRALISEHGIGGCSSSACRSNMNGSEGRLRNPPVPFARNLAAQSNVPVVLVDERLSTAAVTRDPARG
jgi:putative Holliday junction resolvase